MRIKSSAKRVDASGTGPAPSPRRGGEGREIVEGVNCRSGGLSIKRGRVGVKGGGVEVE